MSADDDASSLVVTDFKQQVEFYISAVKCPCTGIASTGTLRTLLDTVKFSVK